MSAWPEMLIESLLYAAHAGSMMGEVLSSMSPLPPRYFVPLFGPEGFPPGCPSLARPNMILPAFGVVVLSLSLCHLSRSDCSSKPVEKIVSGGFPPFKGHPRLLSASICAAMLIIVSLSALAIAALTDVMMSPAVLG